MTEQAIHRTEPSESSKQSAKAVAPEVDYATDLFNMLSMDGSSENAAGASGDDDAWAGFQCMCLNESHFHFSPWL